MNIKQYFWNDGRRLGSYYFIPIPLLDENETQEDWVGRIKQILENLYREFSKMSESTFEELFSYDWVKQRILIQYPFHFLHFAIYRSEVYCCIKEANSEDPFCESYPNEEIRNQCGLIICLPRDKQDVKMHENELNDVVTAFELLD